MTAAAVSVIFTEADLVLSNVDVAVTVTLDAVSPGLTVRSPPLMVVPDAGEAGAVMDQVTAWLGLFVPFTVALN
jgi:hypothetical protein